MSEWGDCVTHYYGCKCRERAHKAMTERIEELERQLAQSRRWAKRWKLLVKSLWWIARAFPDDAKEDKPDATD